MREFIATLKNVTVLARSSEIANCYILQGPEQDPLHKSLAALDLSDAIPEESDGFPYNLVNKTQSEIVNGTAYPESQQDPALMILEEFSRITQFARNAATSFFNGERPSSTSEGEEDAVSESEYDTIIAAGDEESLEQDSEVRQLKHAKQRRKMRQQQVEEETGKLEDYEVGKLGEFELLSNCGDWQIGEWKAQRMPPLDTQEWATFMDDTGRVIDMDALRKRIFHGGVDEEIRSELWKFLLGGYSADSTAAEREKLRRTKREEYELLKVHSRITPNTAAFLFLQLCL